MIYVCHIWMVDVVNIHVCMHVYVYMPYNHPLHPHPPPQTVGDLTGVPSIYTLLMDLRRLPFLDATPPSKTALLTAADAATSHAHTLRTRERAARILEALTTTRHNGFPVVDDGEEGGGAGKKLEGPVLRGIVLRKHLMLLLGRRVFTGAQGGDGPLLNLTALQGASYHNDHRYDICVCLCVYVCRNVLKEWWLVYGCGMVVFLCG